jgi:hypothetical protein
MYGLIGGGVALLVLLICVAVACFVRKRAKDDIRAASGDDYFSNGEDRDVVLVNYDFDDGKDGDMPPPPGESPSLKALSNVDAKKSMMMSDLQIETINADSSEFD